MESLNTLCALVLFLAIVSTSDNLKVRPCLLCSQRSQGSTGRLHLEVSFDQLNELITDKMHLKCSGDLRMHESRLTLMMKIGKVGDRKPLAVFNRITGITMRPENGSKTITAVGHVDKVSSQIFLNVTIDRPDEKDAGTYRCQLLYIDRHHQMRAKKELLKVVIEAPDTSTLMKYFEKQLADLKAKNEKLTDYVTNVIATQNKTAATQNKKIADLNTRADNLRDSVKANIKSTQSHDRVLAELNATDHTMRDQLQDFKTKATYQCAFLAKYKFGDQISRSTVLRFRDIVLNLGEAYSNVTGLFTAPVDGLYVFHLTLTSGRKNDRINTYLRVNHKSAASIYAQDEDKLDQSSTSAVVRLQAGDKVDVWVVYKGTFKYLKDMGYTTFSGSLLQAI